MMTGLRRKSLDWDRKERVTPAKKRAIFRTIGVVRSDQVPGSASGAELWRSFAAASAVVERRQASARRFARAAPVWRGGWTTRLPAFRFLFYFVARMERSEIRERHPSRTIVPGLRGVYHWAGQRPDPMAPSGLLVGA